jgi:hypothetical protein
MAILSGGSYDFLDGVLFGELQCGAIAPSRLTDTWLYMTPPQDVSRCGEWEFPTLYFERQVFKRRGSHDRVDGAILAHYEPSI